MIESTPDDSYWGVIYLAHPNRKKVSIDTQKTSYDVAMPFFLYRLEGNEYVQDRSKIRLAGLSGPFCDAIRLASSPEWELSEEGLLNFYVRHFGLQPSEYAVIIDLKPNVEDEVSLYRLKHVWGYSDDTWTPLALELEGLYVDYRVTHEGGADAFKRRFKAPSTRGDQIYEFLYLKDGRKPRQDGTMATFGFGRIGNVNAVLLWTHVFDSFLKRINRKRREIDRQPCLG